MYLSYVEYQNMGGTLDQTAFNDFEFDASTIVDWYTFNRIPKWYKNPADYPEKLKKCVYRLIKLLQELQMANTLGSGETAGTANGGGVAIASQSNDGVSISYNVISASEKLANADKEKEKIIKMYLNGLVDSLGRNLLYRGLYEGE